MSTPYLNTAGKFRARVEKPVNNAWLTEVGKNNTPAIQLPLVIIGGPCDNQRITYYGWLSDGALSSTVKSLHETFNFDGNWGALIRDPQGFEGFDCSIETVMEDYNGKQQCKVKWLNPLKAELAEEEVQSLITSLQGRSMAVIKDLKAKKEAPKEAESDDMKW